MQHGSLPFYRARLAARRVLTLLVASVALAGLTACGDDDDDPTGSSSDITGTWVSDDIGATQYLRITSSTITSYIDLFGEGCYYSDVSQIVSRNGDVLTFRDEDGIEYTAEVRRSGSNLVIEVDEEGQPFVLTFQPSNVNVANLEICADTGGPGDPDFGACSSLPQVAVPGSVQGSLEAGDALDGPYYYDAYRIQLATTTNVRIRMTSTTIDPWIALFDANGVDIAYNDDEDFGAGNYNSLLDVTLTAGCYVVMASSAFEGETGSYTLSTATF